MRAVVRQRYTTPERLRVTQVETPALTDDGVLVRVRAASVNRADWYALTGRPWLGRPAMGVRKPKTEFFGTDFAGVVEAVGKDVSGFEPGDEVFGGRTGAFAEYVNARSVALKPPNVTFEEAATAGVAGLTALQGLRDKAQLQPRQTVLVNGASGGVGTFSVQIAKALGAAKVTAVCRTRNVELVRSLGADRVVDYTSEDFTRMGEEHDVLFDVAGSRSWSACQRVLKRDGVFVIVGGSMKNPLLGPIGHTIRLGAGGLLHRRKVVFFIAKFNRPDLEVLAGFLASGKLRPVVERTYPLEQLGDALAYIGDGHPKGKVVITV